MTISPDKELAQSPLGKECEYIAHYAPQLLFPLERIVGRTQIGLAQPLPFKGLDLWNGFELSWLNESGKPVVAIAEFAFEADSPCLIESKSFKLYLNSFNQTSFKSIEEVRGLIQRDLSAATGSFVRVTLEFLENEVRPFIDHFEAYCLDQLEISTDIYQVEPSLLKTTDQVVSEKLYTHLFKSNCLATGQPDWASLYIHYQGHQIDHESLLKYIISYRQHQGFHEHCVEQIFSDLLQLGIEKLTVYARYTRRGGLDINPFRSNFEEVWPNTRHQRQ